MLQVEAVLLCRGHKFKSSVYCQTFWETSCCALELLTFLPSLVIKNKNKNRDKNNNRLRGVLDVQENNTAYWCRLEVISFLPGVTWFWVVAALPNLSKTSISHIFWRWNGSIKCWILNKYFLKYSIMYSICFNCLKFFALPSENRAFIALLLETQSSITYVVLHHNSDISWDRRRRRRI